jgi:transcriptional regulator GlxA family with amidase domain
MESKISIKTVIFLFDNYTALDVIGPYEVLTRMPGSKIYFAGLNKEIYKDSYGLGLKADYSIHDISEADILLIPGGFGIDILLKNSELLEWIRNIDKTSNYTTSVCAGSLLLAEAGLLDGKKCTTHWGRKKQLRTYNVIVGDNYERYIQDGKFITSAGVSAGIDMALYLASLVAGEQTAKMIQLAMEYNPMPPFDWGTPEKVPKEVLEKMKK